MVDTPKKTPEFITVTAQTLWLKPKETQERIQAWLLMHGVKPEDCAEFTIMLKPALRVRFVLYDRNLAGEMYMVGGKAAAFMETRKLYSVPDWIENYFADGFMTDKPA